MRRETPCWDALAARQHQDFSRHSAAPPTAHILAEGDRTCGADDQYLCSDCPLTSLLGRPLKSDQKRCGFVLPRALKNRMGFPRSPEILP